MLSGWNVYTGCDFGIRKGLYDLVDFNRVKAAKGTSTG